MMSKKYDVCVIGVGYVGSSLLKNFSRKFSCIGFDIVPKVPIGNTYVTLNVSNIKNCDMYIVSIDTDISERQPNINNLESTLNMIYGFIQCGAVLSIESTVPIGTCDQLLKKFRKLGVYCGFSPERINPGMDSDDTHIPKLISGIDADSLNELIIRYAQIYSNLVPVASMRIAEAAKLIENCFRVVNIAYANEVYDMCNSVGLKYNDVVKACSTKPFGYMPFYPGLGVSGNCIPVNPYYLMKAERMGLLNYAINQLESRPKEKAIQMITNYRPDTVLVVGITFKPNISSTKKSCVITFVNKLLKVNVNVKYYDPIAECTAFVCDKETTFNSEYIDENFDVVAICVRHDAIDMKVIESLKKSIVIDYTS